MNTSLSNADPGKNLNKIQIEVDGLFQPIDRLISDLEIPFWSLMVNYNLRGYDHFETNYPDTWVREYVDKNYAFLDPCMQWAMFRQGHIRWSETKMPDALGVLKSAQRFSINFGAVFSRKTGAKRTALFVARKDRELNDEELYKISDVLNSFFEAVTPKLKLSEAEIDALALLVKGQSFDEIAEELNVSTSAIKTRISSARKKLSCKNNAQLIYKAVQESIIL